MASSGVWAGMQAAGVMRSARSRKCSAVSTLKARQVARRVSSSAMRGTRSPTVG